MLKLSQIPESITHTPRYDRDRLRPRILHIGLGAFHRAHQALLTDRLLTLDPHADWGYCEVNLLGGEALIQSMRAQDHLYTVLEKGAHSQQALIIGSIKRSLSASLDGIEAILETMADPEIEIVSLTITEKGYGLRPGGVALDLDNPAIQHDLNHPTQPKSAPGYLVEALHRRRQRKIKSFTALSCDNMPENGDALKAAVIGLATARDPELAHWIEQHTTFPCTMVDRIVPAATEETLAEIQAQLGGMRDPCAIACEPFIQWVIEDRFTSARPDWDRVGATFVEDVIPFEEMKLRMLNGSHSFLAYLGTLAGYPYINSCMQDPAFKKATLALMLTQQAPTLRVPKSVDLTAYAEQLIERFSNPALQHETAQIAMDGTQKLPQRLLASIRWHIDQGSDYRWLALGVAAWMRYVSGEDDAHRTIHLRDPMAESLHAITQTTVDGPERVRALLNLTSIFGEDLAHHPDFIAQVTELYNDLKQLGAKAVVEREIMAN